MLAAEKMTKFSNRDRDADGGAGMIGIRPTLKIKSMQVVFSCVDSACSFVFNAWVGCRIDFSVLEFNKPTRVIKLSAPARNLKRVDGCLYIPDSLVFKSFH